MEIDINKFRQRLELEIARGNTNAAAYIRQEIRLVEDMKASLMEEMDVKTEDFLTYTAAKLDTYVFQLQEIEKNMGLRDLALDQKTALEDEMVRQKFSDEVDKLHQIDPEKHPEQGLTDNKESV
ncbi:hypothetical protein I5M27_17385 [Adhaeribacter sp. BT258]|uniref:Uncharacterized protein n=1 Tax=Adhaeribacter terrigena TaxID=2793070 RepID=A0ABS1C5V6_9BACT|nr:hypothetical protein [Adhaeribacter terrigena]MBK0404770.1 hypothetical protein [Adhaeribacter terrigena]